jgi:hypothetical protein
MKKALLVMPRSMVALVGLVSSDGHYQDDSCRTGTYTVKDVAHGKCNLTDMASTLKSC